MMLVSLFLLLLGVGVNAQDLRPDIDEFVETVMACSGAPGVSLAVVRNGQVDWQRSFSLCISVFFFKTNVTFQWRVGYKHVN